MGILFDFGELIIIYDNQNELFGGIVKVESLGESFYVVVKNFKIEILNMGLLMI